MVYLQWVEKKHFYSYIFITHYFCHILIKCQYIFYVSIFLLWMYADHASWNKAISAQFSHSVMSDSLWPHESSTPGLPVHHQLPEFTQTHVHRLGDAIQPSHPLSSPSPHAPNLSQHQSLFQCINSSHEVAKV